MTLYANEMVSALQTFDQSMGVNRNLNLYYEALKYNLATNILGKTNAYPSASFDILSASSKNCN